MGSAHQAYEVKVENTTDFPVNSVAVGNYRVAFTHDTLYISGKKSNEVQKFPLTFQIKDNAKPEFIGQPILCGSHRIAAMCGYYQNNKLCYEIVIFNCTTKKITQIPCTHPFVSKKNDEKASMSAISSFHFCKKDHEEYLAWFDQYDLDDFNCKDAHDNLYARTIYVLNIKNNKLATYPLTKSDPLFNSFCLLDAENIVTARAYQKDNLNLTGNVYKCKLNTLESGREFFEDAPTLTDRQPLGTIQSSDIRMQQSREGSVLISAYAKGALAATYIAREERIGTEVTSELKDAEYYYKGLKPDSQVTPSSFFIYPERVEPLITRKPIYQFQLGAPSSKCG